MSATLGALVIAIATEFSVILSARYHEERGAGLSVGEALRRTYARTGAAVLASGVTAIAGFAVLIATDIRMLRDFGLVTVVDLGVALAGVMLVLPAALVWAESGFAPRGSAVAPRRPRRLATPADGARSSWARATSQPPALAERARPARQPLLALRRPRLRRSDRDRRPVNTPARPRRRRCSATGATAG